MTPLYLTAVLQATLIAYAVYVAQLAVRIQRLEDGLKSLRQDLDVFQEHLDLVDLRLSQTQDALRRLIGELSKEHE